MIYEDLRPAKEAIIKYIKEETWTVGGGRDQEKFDRLWELCKKLPVDQKKLRAILRNQIACGNAIGAIKVIRSTRDRKFNFWGRLLVSPIVFPVAAAAWLLTFPLRFVKWILDNL